MDKEQKPQKEGNKVCVLEQCLRNNQAGGNFQCVRSWPRDKLCSEEPESNQLRQGRGTGKRKPQKSSSAKSRESPE